MPRLADSLGKFLQNATELVQREGVPGGLRDFQQKLGETLGEAISFLYFTRKHRDRKLAEGFEKYPKGTYNSEAQIALSRQHASAEIRAHTLVKELIEAIRTRIDINKQQMYEER